MKLENQRIAIAEACGWKKRADDVWYSEERTHDVIFSEELPDYLNDLNAMHEAEKVLTEQQHKQYRYSLTTICGLVSGIEIDQVAHNYISATASQRAEAFLKTLGLWKE